MKKSQKFIIFLFLILIIGCGYFKKLITPISNNPGSISGTIKDGETLEPIRDVSIVCNGKETKTNNYGYYLLDGIKSGPQTILIKKPGYKEKNLTVEIYQGKIYNQPEIYLESIKTYINDSEIDRNTTWSQDKSLIYIVTGELEIPNNVTLTIEEGVIVQFRTNIEKNQKGCLKIDGTLIVNGNFAYNKGVIFTSYEKTKNEGDWKGLVFCFASGKITDCIVEFAEEGIYAYQCSGLEIKNSKIRNNSKSKTSKDEINAGIFCAGVLDLIIENCEIKNNKNGIYCGGDTEGMITKNIIENNSQNGIYCKNSNQVKIEKNTICANGTNGIWYLVLSPYQIGRILNNNIINNGKNGIENARYAVKGNGINDYKEKAMEIKKCYIANNDGKEEKVIITEGTTSQQREITQCENGIFVIEPLQNFININQ